jgi:hypothetical protein
MLTKIDRLVLEAAQTVAEKLRASLLQRLAGRRVGAMSCGCGAIHNGEAEVVDISYSSIDGEHSDMIGLYQHFSCHLREIGNPHKSNYDYSMSVCSFLPWAELHVMFRDAFAGIAVPTEHHFAEPFLSGTGFQGSGHTAVVSLDKPVYIRPIGDLSKSLWLKAKVHVERNLPRYVHGVYVLCVIDPFEIHFGNGPASSNHPATLKPPVEFAFRQFDLNVLNPLVKVVAVSDDGLSATLETHVGIEFYQP